MASIAVDIDSTLYDFETPSREAMLKLYRETGDPVYKEGHYHPWTEWRSPNDVLGTEKWLKAIALVHDASVIETMQPFPGAVETCQALVDAGHELLYISNRATESKDATYRWLNDFGFMEDNTDLVCTSGDKTPYMTNCQYIIDDRLKTVVGFVHDYDWEKALRENMNHIRNLGPDEDSEFYSKYLDAQQNALEYYYDNDLEQKQYWLRMAREIGDQAAKAYYEANRRRAFVKGYNYNQAGTDIPGLYIALTWAGINEYLVSKGVLPEPAAIPLGVLG